MDIKDDMINKSPWLYRNITGRKGLSFSEFIKVKDDIQILETSSIKQTLKKKDYLEKKLANVKKKQKLVDKMELKAIIKNFNTQKDIEVEVKNEIGKLLKKKYPKYSYLIKTENDEEFRKNSITRRRYSSISSTPHFINNTTISSISEDKSNDNKSGGITASSSSYTIKTDDKSYTFQDNENDADDEEEISYQDKYSGFINPVLETISTKNKKNVVKKQSKAVSKIIQVSNDLRDWTNENLSKKDIEPLEDYLERSGHNIYEGKRSFKVSLPSIMDAKDDDEDDNVKEEESTVVTDTTYFGNMKAKKKKKKKDNEFDILLNACRLMVLDSNPPMPIHVTEEHNIPYEFIEKITDNLGVDITKVKQAKNKITNKKKNNENKKEKKDNSSNAKRFQYGIWYLDPSKWNLMREKREQCKSIQMYPSSENWNKYLKFHKFLESPYAFDKGSSDSQSDNE
ncbi:hypothetical protein H8356DRAFT_1303516 [Neocallimastix lanati (nom. inval.)]|nr:hypothetical protein H8356DRAFT_1303516 [Neocallimastix sp. JGI-2020a]